MGNKTAQRALKLRVWVWISYGWWNMLEQDWHDNSYNSCDSQSPWRTQTCQQLLLRWSSCEAPAFQHALWAKRGNWPCVCGWTRRWNVCFFGCVYVWQTRWCVFLSHHFHTNLGEIQGNVAFDSRFWREVWWPASSTSSGKCDSAENNQGRSLAAVLREV